MPLVEDLKAAQLPPPQKRRAIRVGAGVTLREMAAELSRNPMTVLRWERGEKIASRADAKAYRELLEALDGLS